jgi:hypothetical protein
LAFATSAATNNPQAPPAKASPLRSKTCAHLLTVERVFHGLERMII